MRKLKKSRSLTRFLVIQAVFNQSFGFEKNRIEKEFISENSMQFFTDMKCDFKKKEYDKVFFKKIFNAVFDENEKISKLISENLKNTWETSRLPKILNAILKVAISEMIVYPRTSLGIIITEYLILAETFSVEKENGFINGILDKIYREIKNNG